MLNPSQRAQAVAGSEKARAKGRRGRRRVRPATHRDWVVEPLEPRSLMSVSAVGAEVRVNTTTTNTQRESAVAMDDSGNFVAVWSSKVGASYDIYAQRYNAAGVPQGGETTVSSTAGDQRNPAVAMDADGDFVITWWFLNGSNYEIYARAYTANGSPRAAEFRVNSTISTALRRNPSVAVDSTSDIVVFGWESYQGTKFDVYGRRYNALTGSFTDANEFRINNTTTRLQQNIAIACDDNGSHVVFVWDSDQASSGKQDIYARRYDATTGTFPANEFVVASATNKQVSPSVSIDVDGTHVVFAWTSKQTGNYDIYARRYNAVTASFPAAAVTVNTTTSSVQDDTSVAVDSDGDFVIAWDSNQSGTYDIYARQYDPSGTAQTGETLINTTTTNTQLNPYVATPVNKDFVVVWEGEVPGDTGGIAMQMFRRDPIATGSEFRVNTTLAGRQWTSAVANDNAGDFVVVWQAANQDNADYSYGIYAQRYNSSGVAQGSEVRVNTTTNNQQIRPAVAMDDAGDFVVVWMSKQSGSDYDIYAQRYNPSGVAQGSEFRVNVTTTNEQGSPSVAMDSTGNFVITWSSLGQDALGTWGIYYRRYNASGTVQSGGTDVLVNTTTANDQRISSVAMDSAGDYVIAWTEAYGNSNSEIYFQRYNSSGTVQGANTLVTGAGVQVAPAVAMDYDGDFVITWSGSQTGSYEVYARRYDNGGIAKAAEFRVNTTTANAQLLPAIALDDDGDFVIAWMSKGQDNGDGSYGVYAQRYNAAGTAIGSEFRANTFTTYAQLLPSVAVDVDGDFIIVWSSANQDPQDYGVYGQRYTAAAVASVRIQAGGNPASAAQGIGLAEGQQLVGSAGRFTIASLDTGIDYTHPSLYRNIWINQAEVPAWVRNAWRDGDGDGRITIDELNGPRNRGHRLISDLNGNGYIDAGDLLYSVALGGWADGRDNDHNGYVDDLVGWDFVNNDNDPYDDNSHGTHGASVIAQVDPRVELMPLKFLASDGSGLVPQAVAAMEYALKQGVHVSAGAWSANLSSPAWQDELLKAQGEGHIFVAAAGNGDPVLLDALASVHRDNVIVVAATNTRGNLARFTNADRDVIDLAAPGARVLGAVPGGGYEGRSGTSIAVDFVAGALGLIWGANPDLGYREVVDAIFGGADPVPELVSGAAHGRLDIFGALTLPPVDGGFSVPQPPQAGRDEPSVVFLRGDDGIDRSGRTPERSAATSLRTPAHQAAPVLPLGARPTNAPPVPAIAPLSGPNPRPERANDPFRASVIRDLFITAPR